MMSNDLIQCLMNLRKSDMQDNALHFDEKLPSSWSKDKMAEKLAQIYMDNAEKFLTVLSLYTLLFISEIFDQKANGKIPLDTKNEKFLAVIDDVCRQLEVWGLVHYENAKVNVADFIVQIVHKRLSKAKDIVVEMQEMEECAIGIIIAYGFLQEDKFIEILRRCFPQIKAEHIKSFLYHRTNVFIDVVHVSIGNSIWWFHQSIENMLDWYYAMIFRIVSTARMNTLISCIRDM